MPRLSLLDRYTSIFVLAVSNFGFFYGHFTPETCQKYFLIPSVFKGKPSDCLGYILLTSL
jgi:hypothetical protein